jgi:hypothetical protein
MSRASASRPEATRAQHLDEPLQRRRRVVDDLEDAVTEDGDDRLGAEQ